MRQKPLGQFEIIVGHCNIEEIASPQSKAAHIDHRPEWIAPVSLPASPDRSFIDQLNHPKDVAMKVDVIEELYVIGLSASIKKQLHECFALRVGRSVVFAFAGDAAQRRVPILRGSGFKVIV